MYFGSKYFSHINIHSGVAVGNLCKMQMNTEKMCQQNRETNVMKMKSTPENFHKRNERACVVFATVHNKQRTWQKII